MHTIIVALLTVGLASAATLERIERDSLGRLFLFCSEAPPQWSSELSADKHRILLTLSGTTAAPQLRSRSWSDGLLREAYVQHHDTSIQVYITAARPTGYTAVWLPYSRCLMVTLLRWEELSPSDDLYHSALLALEVGANAVADSLLAEAIQRGHGDAATLEAVRALLEGKPLTALQYVRQAASRSSLPDFYGVVSHLAEIAGMPSVQSWAYSRFYRWAARSLPPLPAVPSESLAVLADALLAAPLLDTAAVAATDTSARGTPPAAPTPSDSVQVPARSVTETPEWLLLGGPLLFVLLLLFCIGFLLRSLLRGFQRRSFARERSPQPQTAEGRNLEPSPEAFPAYVQQVLLRYRASDGEHAVSSAEHSPSGAPEAVAPASLSSPVHGETRTEQSCAVAREPSAEVPIALAQLWRQRLQHRSELLRQQLQQLSTESIPTSQHARARLARRLRLPQESVELHWRLNAGEPPDALLRFRMQVSASFVSDLDERSHSGAQE